MSAYQIGFDAGAIQATRNEVVELPRGKAVKFEASHGGEIHVAGGTVWLQPERHGVVQSDRFGDLVDYILCEGDSMRIEGRGPVVISALREASLSIMRAVR